METPFRSQGTVLAVERAAVLLKRLAQRKRPIGVRELARQTGYSPATVQKLLNALAAQGLVHQDPKTKQYALGLEAFRIGVAFLRGLDLPRVAYPVLERLVAQTQESAYLSLLTPDRRRCVFVAKVECDHLLRWTAELGAWRPLNCTADGKAILACLPDDHLRYLQEHGEFHKVTSRSITDPERLKAEIERVRRQGYATSDEEFAEGVRSVAAPVLDYTGAVRGAVSVAGPKLRMPDARWAELGRTVRRAGEALSRALGYDDPEGFYAPSPSEADDGEGEGEREGGEGP